MRRKWAERIVIAVAALASVATSPRKWHLEAAPPPPVAGKAMVVTLEASQEPDVWFDHSRGGWTRLYPTDGASASAPNERPATSMWPGRARYFVPSGVHLKRIEITGRCTSGSCSRKCKAPDTAYLKMASAEAVDGWIAEHRSAPVTTLLDGRGPTPRYRVTVEASRRPIAIAIEGAPDHLAPSVMSGVSGSTSTFYVSWPAHKAQVAPVTVTWTVRATIEGECAGTAACAVPAGEAVRVISVRDPALDEP